MATDPNQPAPQRKARVFTEEVKQRQVSHWDWDYLTTDELEQLQREREANSANESDAPE